MRRSIVCIHCYNQSKKTIEMSGRATEDGRLNWWFCSQISINIVEIVHIAYRKKSDTL